MIFNIGFDNNNFTKICYNFSHKTCYITAATLRAQFSVSCPVWPAATFWRQPFFSEIFWPRLFSGISWAHFFAGCERWCTPGPGSPRFGPFWIWCRPAKKGLIKLNFTYFFSCKMQHSEPFCKSVYFFVPYLSICLSVCLRPLAFLPFTQQIFRQPIPENLWR